MNRKILLLPLSLALAPATASATTLVYIGDFQGANEVPANGSPGTGIARVTYDDVANTLLVQAKFSGLLGNTSAAHIHIGNGPGTNGGVATPTPSFPGFPGGVTSGSYSALYDLTLASSYNASFITNHGGTVGSAQMALASGLAQGRGYWNIHSNLFPGGEIRADLSAAPEPATWGMMILGFAAIGAAMRARKVKVSVSRA